MPAIRVHHLEMSRSHRVLWLLEELGADFEVVRYERDRNFRADPALKDVFPLGKAPLVEIDGTVLAESGAIIEGLLDRIGDGRLRPEPGTESYDWYRFFLHYAEGSLMPPLLVSLILSKMVEGVPFFLRPVIKAVAGAVNANFTNGEFETHFGFIESHLASHTWFAGDDITAADIQMIYPVAAGPQRAGLTRESHPNIFRWLDAVKERPAYKKALETGGPLFP